MKEVETFFNALFILSPAIGFLPQILARDIFFPEVLSLLTIIANVLKLCHYASAPFSPLIALQAIFIVLLHCFLIHFNAAEHSPVENLIFKTFRLRTLKKRYGNKAVYAGLISLLLLTLHLLGFVFCSLAFCGLLSLVFELSINILQVVIENDKKEVLVLDGNKVKRSPKELYLFWTIGDLVKIWYMTKIVIPHVYIATALLQLLLDGYLLLA